MSLEVEGKGYPTDKADTERKCESPIKAPSTYSLESNAIFQDLRKKLDSFYEYPCKKNQEIIHSSLHSLLNEIVFTQDRNIQMKMLLRVSKWYYSKLKSSRAESSTASTRSQTETPSKKENSFFTQKLPNLPTRTPSPSFKMVSSTKHCMYTSKEPILLDPQISENLDRRHSEARARKEKERLAKIKHDSNP